MDALQDVLADQQEIENAMQIDHGGDEEFEMELDALVQAEKDQVEAKLESLTVPETPLNIQSKETPQNTSSKESKMEFA